MLPQPAVGSAPGVHVTVQFTPSALGSPFTSAAMAVGIPYPSAAGGANGAGAKAIETELLELPPPPQLSEPSPKQTATTKGRIGRTLPLSFLHKMPWRLIHGLHRDLAYAA